MTDAAFPDALPALSRLHWYVLERVLGQGGFGITYLAKDTNLDQRVAIKEYLPVEVATRLPDTTVRARTEDLRDRYRWGLERFIQEARTLARFDHPNIVRVLSVFEFNNTAYMVMRFEEGATLSALLDRRGTLPDAELVRLLLPILDGLELVHGAGFIHRDIKPDNIHIRGDGRPVLLDFGSARQSVGMSNTLTILIAPGYAPFEQYYSDPSAQGPWTDIYGLGATCYRVICGRAPLDAVSRSKGILGSAQEVMVPASVVGAGRYSARVLAAIDHALAFAEKDRPQTIGEWRKELIGDGVAPVASPTVSTQTVRSSPSPTPPAATVPLGSQQGSGPAQPPPPPPSLPVHGVQRPKNQAASVGLWKWALVGAAVAAIAIAAYVVTTKGGDETRSKIAALEKQMRDKETADAERERQARKQAEEDALQRKAKEQARPEDGAKAPAELAPKTEAAAKAQQETPKGRAPVAAKPTQRTPPPAAKPPPGAQAPATAPKEPAAQLPTVAPAPAPEPQQPAPRTPAELLAEAERAINAQRYTDAIAIVKPLAAAHNPQAQIRLGDLYAEGHGVDRNASEAARFYEEAALQCDTGAQVKLGAMFASGNGVTRNNNLAYVWYGTAARLGSNAAKAERDKIEPLLQPAERQQADKLIAAKVDRTCKRP